MKIFKCESCGSTSFYKTDVVNTFSTLEDGILIVEEKEELSGNVICSECFANYQSELFMFEEEVCNER